MTGPGIGTLIGLAWGERANEQDFQRERARLAGELQDANEAALAGQAKKDAAKALLNAVTTELQLEAEGKLRTRRLSEPANTAGRNEAFMDTAEGQLRRLSSQQLGFSKTSQARVKSSTRELAEILPDATLNPKLERRQKR